MKMSSCASFLERRSRVTLTILVIGLFMAAFTASTADDGLFSDNFELFTYTDVAHGTIELRAPDGTVRERRSTDGIGRFERFSESLVQPGDKLVVYGGFWRSQPFAGEMTLLLSGPDSYQIVTPITTLVTRLAESGQVDGSTAAQRIDQAVDKLAALFMVGDDWYLPNPEWVDGDLAADIDANGGLLNWGGRLLQQVQAELLEESHMQAFPYANAAIRSVGSGDLERRWLPGDSGQLQLSADLSLESPGGIDYELADGPAWIGVNADGLLSYDVPAAAEPAAGELLLDVTHQTLGRSRTIALDFEIADGSIVAEEDFDASGGEIWHPDGGYGYRILPDAVSGSVTVRLIDYAAEDGDIQTAFRTDPPGYEFEPPLEVLFASNLASRERDGAVDECDIEWDDGWTEKLCEEELFQSVDNQDGPGRLSLNRMPDSFSSGDSFPRGWLVDGLFIQEAWALGARCTDCASRNTPVLFVHGFSILGAMGGGGTWGDLPDLLHDFPGNEFAVYEFRYRSNARFQDIASDLGDAIDEIHSETSQPVRIIAHSFGGLVSRTYLQGLTDHAISLDPFSSCAQSRHPKVAGLLTLGTPHSGISESAADVNGLWLPDGRQLIGGAIELCGQLTCWQAGADEPLALLGDLTQGLDVEEESGGVIAELADFENKPLPVPTVVALGLHGQGQQQRTFAGGDGLISYQGQRFAPALSCEGSSCSNQSIPQNYRTSVDGVPIGHCVTETVLGADENQLYPMPGQVVEDSGLYSPTYYHFGIPPSEAKVTVADLPYLNENGTSWWVSKHDSFNRILDWLLNADNQLMINIQGQGSVEVLADSDLYDCQSSCVLPMTATVASITAQPASGAGFEGFSSNCTGSGQSCDVSVGRATTVNVAFSGGDQALLVVNRSGPGQVTVDPGGQVCTLPQCQYIFAPGTAVTLGAEAGSGALFSGWSGPCADAGMSCSLTLQGGDSATAAAQFIEEVPPEPGDTFKDCPDCPTMVDIPAGSFVQGSPPDEPESDSDERPQRTVNVPAFAIGQTEVTFDEWDACVADGGCSYNPSDSWGRGDQPVIRVNWHDAQEYVAWLSSKTGHDYRLPSESEWEYATRAGTTGRFNTGDCITTDQANFRGTNPAQGCPSGEYRQQTLPVGSFAPNAFGLYDTHGNVWEWVQDCWNGSYEGAPTDGSAWMSGDCGRAVLRGGSWLSYGQVLRSANRYRFYRGYRFNYGGFRVARSVNL